MTDLSILIAALLESSGSTSVTIPASAMAHAESKALYLYPGRNGDITVGVMERQPEEFTQAQLFAV